MIKFIRNTGLYSEEHENLYKEVMKNEKISIDKLDKETIKEIDKYLENIEGLHRVVLEESVKKKINDIELDLGAFIGSAVSIASLEIAIIPVILKYTENIFFIGTILKLLEGVIAILMVILILKINTFYFKRKNELIFNKFILSRIDKIYK